MTEVILTGDQANLVRNAAEQVILRDPEGNCIGFVQPLFTQQEIEEALKRRGRGRKYTTAEVLEHLNSLTPPNGDK